MLTVVSAGNGTVVASPARSDWTYKSGTSVTLTALPDEGNVFVQWSGDVFSEQTTQNPIVIPMNNDKSVTVTFDESDARHTLEISPNPVGGGVVTVEPAQPTGGYIVNKLVNVTATASEGYIFNRWEGALTGSLNAVTIRMDGDKAITAVFDGLYSLAVSAADDVTGTVTVDPEQSEYVEGTTVELTAVPAEGYRFDHWGGDISGSENPITVTMTSAKVVTAYFAKPLPVWLVAAGVIGGLLFLPLVLLFFPPVSRRLRSAAQSAAEHR